MDRRALRLIGVAVVVVACATRVALARGVDLAAKFDQRQEGKVNVQIDVKDVQVLALLDSDMLDDYMQNYDYAYDYADFTIKPGSRPTTSSRPPSSTEAWSTWPSSEASPSSSSSFAFSSDSSSSSTSSTPVDDSSPSSSPSSAPSATEQASTNVDDAGTMTPTVIVLKTKVDASDDGAKVDIRLTENRSNRTEDSTSTQQPQQLAGEIVNSSTVVPASSPEPRKRCPVGFMLKSGRCFKRRLSLISPRFSLMKLAPALLNKSKVLNANQPAAESS